MSAHKGPLVYADAAAYADRARTSKGFMICSNTRVKRSGESVEVIYHRTPVITFHPDSTATLRTNGWRTPTTARRISGLLKGGFQLGTYRGCWLWGLIPFYEGMRVDAAGTVVSDIPQSFTDALTFAMGQIRAASAGMAEVLADPVFAAKERLGVLHPKHTRDISTLLAGKLTRNALVELVLRRAEPQEFEWAVTRRRLEYMIRQGEL